MKLKKKLKSIIAKDQKKTPFLRHIFFTSYKRKGRKILMLLKTKRYLQVGLYSKKKRVISKHLLYKTLHLVFNNTSNINDYLSINKIKKQRDDYCLDLKRKKKVSSVFDLFYENKLLSVKNFEPILLTKFQYNLYDKNYKIVNLFKYINYKNINLLYLQSFAFSNLNNSYFFKFYLNLKNIIYLNIYNAFTKFYLYWNTNHKFSIFKILKNTKFKYVNFGINNYIKFKNPLNVKHTKVLDKYLMKNKMFRPGKFFYNFLEYMKAFSYSVYKKNMLYGKLKYIKFDGNKENTNVIFFNVDKLKRLKGWFSIYNYIKKFTYLSYNFNKHKIISYFLKKYHNFYYLIIRYFFKIINNIKFMFIEKFNFKKIQFFKILILYMFYNKWYKFKSFMRLIRRKKIKRWKIKRIIRFRKLNYISFLLRIKSRKLNSNFLKRFKLIRLIKKRKRLNFFKFKNNLRAVNWLLKFRKFKSIKNPFHKPFKKYKKNFKFKKFNNFNNNKKNIKGTPFKPYVKKPYVKKPYVKKPYIKFNKFYKNNRFKELSNKDKKPDTRFNSSNRNMIVTKPNVKRV